MMCGFARSRRERERERERESVRLILTASEVAKLEQLIELEERESEEAEKR